MFLIILVRGAADIINLDASNESKRFIVFGVKIKNNFI